jgi:hypothetical protein
MAHAETAEHLEDCAECRGFLEELMTGMDLLATDMPQVPPPPSLRGKVLQTAYEKRSPVSGADFRRYATHRPQQLLRSSESPVFKRKRSTWMHVALAALVIVCAVLSAQVVMSGRTIKQLHAELATTLTTVSLHGQGEPSATGEALLIRQGRQLHLIVYVANMKPTMGSEVYHIWLWNHGRRSSAGVMTVDATGTGQFEYTLNDHSLDGIGITLEPNAHTATPVGPKVLGASITAL